VDEKSVFLSFKLTDFIFEGQECLMVIVEDKTSQIAFDKLQFNNRMIKMHASCVSHDMKAPLSAIDFMVEKIINMPGLPREMVRLLKPVRCASKILNIQVFNLLDYNLLQKN
jgi:K+-sensing histidine kinase KdpD